MEMTDHTLDISSHHDEFAPSQSNSVVPEQQTSSMDKASIGTSVVVIIKDMAIVGIILIFLLNVVAVTIRTPIMIICFILLYGIKNINQFAKCDDYVDMYDTALGSDSRDLVVWMAHLTGLLIAEMLVCLAIFGSEPLHLRKIYLVHLPVWKWFLIGIIFLVYFGLWCLSRLLVYKVRESFSIGKAFIGAYMFHMFEAYIGLPIWGFYFLVEFLVFKIVHPSIRPKILGLDVHKWVHALVFLFIGINVGKILFTSFIITLQMKHENPKKIDYGAQKGRKPRGQQQRKNVRSYEILKTYMYLGCQYINSLVFKDFDKKMCSAYVLIRLRRSISLFLISISLLTTWTTHFMHQLRPSPDTVWVARVVTITLYCLLILSILGLLKNSIMLWWEYHSIYNKLYDEVSGARIKLYLLGRICHQGLDVFRVGRSYNIDRVAAEVKMILVDGGMSETEGQNEDQRQLSIYAITRMFKYFLLAKDAFKKDMNESIEKLTTNWRQTHSYHPNDENSRKPLTLDHIKQAYGTDFGTPADFDILLRQIKEENKEGPALGDFESWMNSSYRICYKIANKLASAEGLATYMNRAMVIIIIPFMIGIWLIMFTRSTKLVTVFTAPILAVSFIFTDTISTVFKGITFSYFIRPYDIGDICVIKTIEYEVKWIDFWQTTFLQVGTNEEVFYPNSALFSESINRKSREGSLETLNRLQFFFKSDTDLQNIAKLTNEFEHHFSKKQSIMKQQVEVKYDSRGVRKVIDLTINFKNKVQDDSGVLNSGSERHHLMKRNKEELKNHVIELCKRYALEIANLDEMENMNKS